MFERSQASDVHAGVALEILEANSDEQGMAFVGSMSGHVLIEGRGADALAGSCARAQGTVHSTRNDMVRSAYVRAFFVHSILHNDTSDFCTFDFIVYTYARTQPRRGTETISPLCSLVRVRVRMYIVSMFYSNSHMLISDDVCFSLVFDFY